jgi:hypothetical protein
MNHRARRSACLLATGALCATSLAAAAAATAQAAPAAQAAPTLGIRAGLKPIHPALAAPTSVNTLTVRSNNTQGVVSPHPTVYLVFWGSQWSRDPAKAKVAMQKFFKGLHGTPDTYNSIFTQYCEGVPTGTSHCGTAGTHIVKPTRSILAGVWSDSTRAEPTNATAAQLAAEAIAAAKHFHNTTQAPNTNAQYVVLSPSGTHPDGFPNSGFCAYHNFTTSPYGNLAWTNMPYVPDIPKTQCTTLSNPTVLDGYFSTETHEYSETLTDFWPSIGWNGGGGEIGDECIQLDGRITLPTGTFDVQGEWSNLANKCVTTG